MWDPSASHHLVTFLQRGIATRTQEAYRAYEKHWFNFLESRFTATEWVSRWRSMDIQQQTCLLVEFVMFLHERLSLNHDRIKAVMTAVRHFLRARILPFDCFSHESVRLAIKATSESARTVSIRRENRKRLPVTPEMIGWLKSWLWNFNEQNDRDSLDNKMTFLGIVIGMTFLRRVSEYCHDPKSAHAICTEDVDFILKTSNQVVSSHDAPRARLALGHIECARFIFRSSKTDQGGRGAYKFLRATNSTEFELIKCILHWCNIAGLTPGQPFLSRFHGSYHKSLRSSMVNNALRTAADHFGFHDTRHLFSTHSLRIGGATTLISSGATRETIQRIGNWRQSSTASDSIYELNTPLDSSLWSQNSYSNRLSSQHIASIIPPSKVTYNR